MSNIPDRWQEVEGKYRFQNKAWDNEVTGQTVVIESKREPWHDEGESPDMSVHVLSAEQKAGNAEPITTVIEQTKDPQEAVKAAIEYMATHE